VPFASRRLESFIALNYALPARSPDRQLHREDRRSHNDEENQIEKNEDASAVRARDIRELPHVSDTDRSACADQQETKPRFKIFSFQNNHSFENHLSQPAHMPPLTCLQPARAILNYMPLY
jgi:hypothetical protein